MVWMSSVKSIDIIGHVVRSTHVKVTSGERSVVDMESSKRVIKIIEGKVVKGISFVNLTVCITKLASHGSHTKNGWVEKG